ncbi:MAG: carbon storage regulator [Planctomycetia bacterium]|nr:carbon storage regulator [Planctomycetia bacterium]
MLVLSRKQGEQLQIGDNITITVLEVHGRKLKLGVQAPHGVRILRAELDFFRESTPAVIRRKPAAMLISA